jgi:hypothetical protein
VTDFSQRSAGERVALIERYRSHVPPVLGDRLREDTAELLYRVKWELCSDDSDAGDMALLRMEWDDHLAGLPEVEADSAVHELRSFVAYLEGLR